MKVLIFFIIVVLIMTFCTDLFAAQFDYHLATREQLVERCLMYANLYKNEFIERKATLLRFNRILQETIELKRYVLTLLDHDRILTQQNIDFRNRITYLENYRYDALDFSVNFSFSVGTGGLANIQSVLHFGYGVFGFASAAALYDYTFYERFGLIFSGGIGYTI